MVEIFDVEKGSLADAIGISCGDILLDINGNSIEDVLDYRFYLAECQVSLRVLRGGDELEFKIKKGEYDDIGLSFETALMDKKHSCKNGCIFCFIDQNPKGMRDTIYFKDDDSRLSFIHGNYITLTNMTDKDIDRIIKMRFSPINISVHTTNPELRVKMMKNKRAGDVLRYMDRLADAGISMCGQIVLCKGVNDGEELLRSMRDLERLFPHLGSVSVVPAGLTKYRDGLFPLSDFSKEEAERIISLVSEFSEECLNRHGSRIFFLADEFYLKAGLEIPSEEYYEDYSQIENGVGLLRSFSEEFNFAFEDFKHKLENIKSPRKVAIATGVAAYPTILSMSNEIMKLSKNIRIDVYKIKNKFFGESITVSGLLTGVDIASQLPENLNVDELLIPSSALRSGEDVFLCGTTLCELEDRLGVRILPCENDGYAFFEAVVGKI